MNALSAIDREDELVSLHPRPFAFSLLSDGLPFPPSHRSATTLAAVSSSRTSMPWWSTSKSAMSSSTLALHQAHASRLPWLRRVRRRRHTAHSLHKHLPPHLLHLLPRLPPPRMPARSSHVTHRHFSFPSHSVAQSHTATSHTSKRTDSSTI
jgi:hypothetical protein